MNYSSECRLLDFHEAVPQVSIHCTVFAKNKGSVRDRLGVVEWVVELVVPSAPGCWRDQASRLKGTREFMCQALVIIG